MTDRRALLKSGMLLGGAAPFAGLASSAAAAPLRAGDVAARGGTNRFPPAFNPMAGNPLRTRDDVVRAIRDLYLPLTLYYSPGAARVRLDMAGSTFDFAATDLEGYARPLWGLAPLARGGGADFVDWGLFRRGLANGTDPAHPEYWGDTSDGEQRLVELAAIGFALALVPELLWGPQPASAKANIANYLGTAFRREFNNNNWMFFRLMIGLGLTAIGAPADHALIADYERKLDAFYMGDGWYRDGPARRADHYVGFALHFYALLYGKLSGDAGRARIAAERARAFAPDFARWFADDGAVVPFGRSMTYRFGCASFWSALAFADVEALPWGVIKGIVLRHLRWWSDQPIALGDGVLSIGYGYPTGRFAEPYNSPSSPYWAFKVFGVMALPATHPFWTAPEQALPARPTPSTQAKPGMIVFDTPGDAIALAGGQEEHQPWLRLAPEKYCKFAYSARYGFGVETDLQQFESASFENMLGFSVDGRHFRGREGNKAVLIADNLLHATWSTWDDVEVETWSWAAAPWHVRVHRIKTGRAFKTVEGGFAIARREGAAAPTVDARAGAAMMQTATDLSGVLDLGSTVARLGRVINALANSNIVNTRSSVPQLRCDVPAGLTVLRTAVLALGDPRAGATAWASPPAVPDIASLEARIAASGVAVATMAQKV